jgi:hypothetical protein
MRVRRPSQDTSTQPQAGHTARGIERAAVLQKATEVIDCTSALPPAAVLAVVSEALAHHLGLTCVVLFKRAAGQSRSIAWSAADVPAARRLAAREHAWTTAAALVDHGMPVIGPSGPDVASVAVEDVELGVSGMMYVESTRALGEGDRWLLEEVLRRLLATYTNGLRGGAPSRRVA